MSTHGDPPAGPADLVGIVLAGGRSHRFGGDKLAAPVDGRTMLSRAVDAVRVATGRVIVVASTGAGERVADAIGRNGRDVRVVEDPTPFEGPLAGLASGLGATTAPLAVIVPGDSPWIVPGVLGLLAAELRAADADVAAAVLVREGRPERFPFAIRTAEARSAIAELAPTGERRVGALVARLRSIAIPEGRWREIDPDGLTLRDVDRPEDLSDR